MVINREDTIDVIYDHEFSNWCDKDEVSTTLNDLPSADRPQGHYIKGESGEWYCSECKRIDDKYSVANFCWYCGADMRGEKDETD